MCLLLLAKDVHPEYPLIVAANRDEEYRRPTAPAHFWDDHAHILAGRDLKHGGTWLGVTRSGHFAAITNVRHTHYKHNAPSRGEIVEKYLRLTPPADQYITQRLAYWSSFNGFNLIAGDYRSLYFFSNQEQRVKRLAQGIHGLSNASLNTPWPKVEKGKRHLAELLLQEKEVTASSLFSLLADSLPAQEDQLPQTGVSLEWEKILSPLFIQSRHYGTRSSTVLLVDHRKRVFFNERVYTGQGKKWKDYAFSFSILHE